MGSTGRRAFVLAPLALVLWIALLILGVALWMKTPPAGYVPAKGVGPGQIGSVILALLYGGFWFFMACRVAENKSRAAANVTAVITLGFGAVMLGLSYAGLTKDQRGLAAQQQGTPPVPVTQGGMSTNPVASNAGVSAGPSRDGARPTSPREGGSGSNAGLSANPGANSGATPRTAPAAGSGAEAPAAAAPAATPAPKPAPAVDRDAEAAKLTEAVGEQSRKIEQELELEASAVLAAAEKLVPPLVSPIAHDLVKIRKALEGLEELRGRVKALEEKYQAADKRLEAGLKEAGFSVGDSAISSSRWGSSYRLAQRGFGCQALGRTCDKAIEEIGYLKDNFPKWTLTAKGELRVFEKPLESKINSNRFFTKAEADRFRSVQKQIQDGN